MQNFDTWEPYRQAIRAGEVPLARAYRPSPDERLIRELVLQLKRGSIRPGYFQEKYGVDVRRRFAEPLASLSADGYLAAADDDRVALTRDALLRVDVLLHRFFLPEHTGIRYT
jgi:oxygen-independent coproporphyrinogen-3 oxidase